MISLQNKVFIKTPLGFGISDIPEHTAPRKILMVTPDYFDIVDVKNAHMEGHEGKVDKKKARDQWERLKLHYTKLVARNVLDGFLELPGAPDCEDMVFAANQTFPWVNEKGEKIVILSKMKHASRQREVVHFEKFFSELGYKILQLEKTLLFEGMGDTIPHPGKRLLYGGYGHRSEKEAYDEIAGLLNVPVICLELKDDRFYHLDTCFVPLDEKTVMLQKAAFTEQGLELITHLFEKVIEIPEEEAAKNFALNAHVICSPGNKVAILQQGNERTNACLKEAGFEVIEVDTSEFMKSGGSVFCMKMMLY